MRAVTFDGRLTYSAGHPDPRPEPGECLVRVHLAGICGTDLQITRGYMGFRGIVGHEFVGTVSAGSLAWRGKRVVGEINCVCGACDLCLGGLSNHCRKRTVVGILGRDGCFADLLCLPERNLHAVPDAVTDEQAVFVEPLAAAFQVIAQCPVERHTRVTVLGSGRLGILVAQVLASAGCKLSVVGRNREKLQCCEKRGIQTVALEELVPRQDRDVVVECTGTPEGLKLALEIVRPRGTVVLKSTHAHAVPIDLAPAVVHEVRIVGSRCGPFPEAINALARSAVDVRPLITHVYPIEQALDAFAAAQSQASLKILVRMG